MPFKTVRGIGHKYTKKKDNFCKCGTVSLRIRICYPAFDKRFACFSDYFRKNAKHLPVRENEDFVNFSLRILFSMLGHPTCEEYFGAQVTLRDLG
jgi:hypothetical protein